MEIQERLHNILKKIIVPHYVEIEDVLVTRMNKKGDYFKVTYFTNQRIGSLKTSDIWDETESLFQMTYGNDRANSGVAIVFDNLKDGPDVE